MSKIAKIMQQAAAGAVGEALAIEDVFSTYLYTGNGAAQVIENGIRLGQSFSSGSVRFDGDQADSLSIATNAALDLAPGDFTIEMWVYPNRITNYQVLFDTSLNGSAGANMTEFWISPSGNIQYYAKGSIILTSSATLSANNWYHIALVKSSGTDRLYVNGALSASVSSTTSPNTGYTWYIGDRVSGAVSGQYPLQGNISNFRIVKGVGVYTSAFTPPTSNLTAISGTSLLICQGDNPFVDNSTNAFTITKNGDPQAKTFGPFDAAEAGEGGLVWLKARSAANWHGLYDTERGVNKFLATNVTNAEISAANTLTSFNANGFTIGAIENSNFSGETAASWTFRKAPRFFDVVTYAGNETTNRKIDHNLGVVPGCIIVKAINYDGGNPWSVYHRNLGATKGLRLNTTSAATTDIGYWYNQSPTDTQFGVGADSATNGIGINYVAYLFAHDPLGPSGDGSDGLIACGSMATGNDTVSLGWEPQWIMFKRTDNTGSWWMVDTMRGLVTGGDDQYLVANTSGAEGPVELAEVTSSGFTGKLGTGTYIYIAIRRGPMREPTSGTEVFAPVFASSSGNYTATAGFPVDSAWYKWTTGTAAPFVFDRLRGNPYLLTSANGAETASTGAFDSNVNFRVTGASGDYSTYINYLLRRAPGFFDMVAYTGNGVAGRTVPHNLGVAPELMIVKRREGSGNGWKSYVAPLGPTYALTLNETSQAELQGSTLWNSTAPSSEVFSVGTNSQSNASGGTYIAYLFATLPGVSKVGSYTGNGSSQTIDCGFTGGARFVLIKRTDSTGDWIVGDATRGIVAGNDPYFKFNANTAADTDEDWLDTDNSGFIVNQVTTSNANVNTATYIYLAIA